MINLQNVDDFESDLYVKYSWVSTVNAQIKN